MTSNFLPLNFGPSQASSRQNSNVDNFQPDRHNLLKSLSKFLVLLYELLLFPFYANNPITVITYFQCSGIWYGSIGNLMLSSQCQQTTTLYTETRLIYVEIMAPLHCCRTNLIIWFRYLKSQNFLKFYHFTNKILFVSQFSWLIDK